MTETSELYELLIKSINNNNSNNYILNDEICNIINNLPLIYSQCLLGLIFHFYVIDTSKRNIGLPDLIKRASTKTLSVILPYKGKTYDNGKGPEFFVNKLPINLQKILVAYIKYIQE